MAPISNWFRSVHFLMLLLVLTGCGAKRPAASVIGTVKYAGELVATGSIRFDPVDVNETKSVGAQIKEGKYEISLEAGLVEGDYFVAVFGTRETGKLVASAETLHNAPTTPSKEIEQYIPEKYNADSKLKAPLKAGANVNQDFDLPAGEKPVSSTPSAPKMTN